MNLLEYYTYSKNSTYVTRMFWISNDDVMFIKIDYYETNLLECSSPHKLKEQIFKISLFYNILSVLMTKL